MSRSSSPSPYFLPYQVRWIEDQSLLKIIEKSRQIGITHADAYDSVRKASGIGGLAADVWVSSRDKLTAMQYLRISKEWVQKLDLACENLGLRILDSGRNLTAYVLRFASGKCIFSLSSNPDSLAGKTGHIKLDEFALHKEQRELYATAKPCTTWGFQLSIISTHRDTGVVFRQILKEIKTGGNPMGFSHHRVTLLDAIADGLVEKINEASGRDESREAFTARIRRECLDESQWLQEYMCEAAEDQMSFLGRKNVEACIDPELAVLEHAALLDWKAEEKYYVGVDIGRSDHLFVMDIGVLVGDVLRDCVRVELRGATFEDMERRCWAVLMFAGVQRLCVDSTGLGAQLAENLEKRFGKRVERVVFTSGSKEALAYELYRAFESRRVRIPLDGPLIEDLCAVRKIVTDHGYLKFEGETSDSHSDRFWAKALRQWAARKYPECGAAVAA